MKQLFAVLLCMVAWPAMGAQCWVTELSSVRPGSNASPMQVADFAKNANGTAVTTQVVATITATEQSAAFGSGTQMIRIWCDIQVYFSVGLNPTATTSQVPLVAESVEYIGVADGWKIAFCDSDCT